MSQFYVQQTWLRLKGVLCSGIKTTLPALKAKAAVLILGMIFSTNMFLDTTRLPIVMPRVQPEVDYLAGNLIRTRILFPVNSG